MGRVSVQQVAADAFGNALGESISSQSPGVDWSAAPDQSDAETARLNRHQPVAQAADVGGYFPSRSAQSGLTFSDAYGPVNSLELTVAANRLDLGLSPDERTTMPLPRGLTDKLSRTIAINDSLLGLRDQVATDRALRNLGDLAEASRASGMTGATGDLLTIESSVLAEPGLKSPSDGFFFGLGGGQRSALDGAPAAFAEKAGQFARGLLAGPVTSAIGFAREIGLQYSDLYSLVTGSGSSVPLSGLLTSLQREGISGALLNLGDSVLSAPSKPIFDLLEGRYQQAGEGLPATLATGLGLARGVRLGGDAPFSPIVPGGGLMAHELAGGHLLLKHVGLTERQLLDRLVAEPHISGSSSFFDRPIAESVVSAALNARRVDIDAWLATSKPGMKLEYTLQNPVGISVEQGMSSAVDVSSLRLILRRDPAMPTGYRIHTGFPIQ